MAPAILLFTSVLFLSVQGTFSQAAVRWCALNALEMNKCGNISQLLSTTASSPFNITCKLYADYKLCFEAIKRNEADAVTAPADQVYFAGTTYDLHPVASEVSKDVIDGKIAYFAVAAIKVGTTLKKEDLPKATACFTGFGKTAGFRAPASFMIQTYPKLKGFVDKCNIQSALGAFLEGGACLPDASYSKNTLCKACNSTCTFGKDEFSNYDGSIRCLLEGSGKISFNKHSAVLGKPVSLLCSNFSTAKPEEFRSCNFGTVPTSAVVSRSGGTLGQAIEKLVPWVKVQSFDIFNSSKFGGANLLFKDTDVELKSFTGTYKEFLGDYYMTMQNLPGMNTKSTICSGSLATAQPWSSLSYMFALLAYVIFSYL